MNNSDLQNKIAWTKEIKKNVMLYPNERIVAFLARNYKDIEVNSSKKALDIGFGSGRHLKLLLDYGFQTYGTDYSEECLKIANDKLKNYSGLQKLSLHSIEELDYQNETFDVILLYGVAFLRQFEEMKQDLQHIFNLLKVGGKSIVNFRTNEDDMFQTGKKVSEQTYILNDDRYPSYRNMLYTFLSLEEAKELLESTGFKIINIEREDYWKNQLEQKNSWWIFTVEK
ncbi:class I SAM-dependent methyltransferase [Lysinibacillus sp. NPDC059133]|uniref:class I SAM-dependent methyltransferase n=1 Tax=Lysinibacillus sp. NPDC059133 TaxID=3346737 RepID=UPI0036BF55D8